MWPWGHAAVGYLLYAALTRARAGRPPSDAAVVWLAIGTQFPDLIDKPLAWSVAVLPTGRTLSHTLLVAVPFCAAVYLYARTRDRQEWATAFGLGYLSHLLADAALPLWNGEFEYAQFLLWPLLSVPTYDGPKSFVGQFASMDLSGFFAVQLALTAAAAVVWWVDGRPGIGLLRRSAPFVPASNR